MVFTLCVVPVNTLNVNFEIFIIVASFDFSSETLGFKVTLALLRNIHFNGLHISSSLVGVVENKVKGARQNCMLNTMKKLIISQKNDY